MASPLLYGQTQRPAIPAGRPEHGDAPDAVGLTEASRMVLARLREGPDEQSLERLHHATGLGLLEVADAVELLADLGLVVVEREVDELVRLARGSGG